MTRDDLFFDLFGAHASCSLQAVALLETMLNRPQDAPRLQREIHALEREGDEIQQKLVQTLHTTWITPLDRDAIHALISGLDDALDHVDAAAERFALYEVPEARPEALEMVQILGSAARDVHTAVTKLSSMKHANDLLDLCHTVSGHESRADAVYRRALARLFKDAPEPLEVLKWRDIFESLETASNRMDDVSDVIQGIVLEHA